MNHSKEGMLILNLYKKKVNLGIDQHLQRRVSSADLLHSTLTWSTMIFWTRMKTSSVLGCFDIVESKFEKVTYSLPNPVLRKITPRNDTAAIRIFVTVENSDIIRLNCQMKVRMVLSCEVVRYNEDGSVQLQDAFFHYEVIENLRSTDESHVFDVVMQTFDARIQSFNKRGSNCRFQRVISLDIYLVEFRPLNGSSYIKLPEYIQKKKAAINIKNKDN